MTTKWVAVASKITDGERATLDAVAQELGISLSKAVRALVVPAAEARLAELARAATERAP